MQREIAGKSFKEVEKASKRLISKMLLPFTENLKHVEMISSFQNSLLVYDSRN